MGTRSSLVAASLLGCLWVVAGTMTECQQPSSSMESVYSFTAMNINKTMNVSLSEYKGRVLQEPGGTGAEILNGIKYVRPGGGYVPQFMMFEKIDVNGDNEHPLYTYLKKYCPPVTDKFEDMLHYSPLKNEDVRWNFEQFVIDKKGRPIVRYSPDTLPLDLVDTIDKLLNM